MCVCVSVCVRVLEWPMSYFCMLITSCYVQSERDELMDKVRSLQANLDSSYKWESETYGYILPKYMYMYMCYTCYCTLYTYRWLTHPLYVWLLFSRELSELQKANAVTQNAAQEAALSAEQSAREELKNILEQHKVGAQREKEALLMQVR